MKRKFLALFAALLMIGGGLVSAPVYATDGEGDACSKSFLGFRPWYQGEFCTSSDSGVDINSPQGDDQIARFVWTIVLNVLFDASLAVGYLAVVLVVYGGFLYMMSQGDPGRIAKAKRTLATAVMGTVIAMSASVVVNTLIFVLGIDPSKGLQQNEFDLAKFQGVLNWAYAMAGLIAVIFIVKGGIEYMLSTGDASKLSKAKKEVIFAVVGLVLAVLAALITGAVIGVIGGALGEAK